MSNEFRAQPAAQGPVKPNQGRDTGNSENNPGGGSYETSAHCSSRQGTVVIRATVEHIGLAGDTEMTVSVKWPASTFCVQPCAQHATSDKQDKQISQVPANGPVGRNFDPGMLYGEADLDPGPETENTALAKTEASVGTGQTNPAPPMIRRPK
jgi:hypothetical protein